MGAALSRRHVKMQILMQSPIMMGVAMPEIGEIPSPVSS